MKYVDRWKLPYKKTILKYSQGMKVRLMFAAVLARDTKLLILDEATNGLDPVIKEEVLELIQSLPTFLVIWNRLQIISFLLCS